MGQLVLTENRIGGFVNFSLFRGMRRVSLASNNLIGNISLLHRMQDSLASLEALDMSLNLQLLGSIPPSISLFSRIEEIKLRRTGISGALPDSLSSLTSLNSLDLSENLNL